MSHDRPVFWFWVKLTWETDRTTPLNLGSKSCNFSLEYNDFASPFRSIHNACLNLVLDKEIIHPRISSNHRAVAAVAVADTVAAALFTEKTGYTTCPVSLTAYHLFRQPEN